jgi:hypothetical protein
LKRLILLDLDHTIIYGSYAENETADLLFQYNTYLKVYERPFAKELVAICKQKGDIIVYTTSLRPYALKICKKLTINPTDVLSRKHCFKINNQWRKKVKLEWENQYDTIIIIDDSPNIWELNKCDIEFFVPSEFRGSKNDFALEKIILELNVLF